MTSIGSLGIFFAGFFGGLGLFFLGCGLLWWVALQAKGRAVRRPQTSPDEYAPIGSPS